MSTRSGGRRRCPLPRCSGSFSPWNAGLLQGFQRYLDEFAKSIVAEGALRILFALVLVAAGLDVTGAFLGSALSLVALAVALQVPLSEVLPGSESLGPRLKALAAGSWDSRPRPHPAPGAARRST